jgi:hypothetical protein
MRRVLARLAFALLAACASPLAGGPSTQTKATALVETTHFRLVATVPLRFDVFHPQGLTRVGERFVLSAVEIVERPTRFAVPQDGHDRSAGRGIGHVFAFDSRGTLLAHRTLGEGDVYHPGGIDYDGESIWVPVAEYRPASRSIVYRVDPVSLEAREAFRVDDHIGALVRDRSSGELIGLSWGGRGFYAWRVDGTLTTHGPTPGTRIEAQDCDSVGSRAIVCAAVGDEANGQRGGLLFYERIGDGLRLRREIAVPLQTPQRHSVTRNAEFIEWGGRGPTLYAVPDDGVGMSMWILAGER